MKVTHTVLHLETEQEKQMLIKAVAREIVDKAAVASVDDGYEAESNLIPQFEPPIPVAAISEAELEDIEHIEPEVCTCNHYEDDQEEETQGPIRTLTSYLFKHKDSDRVTPVYVSRVEEPVDEDVREAKREAALKLFKLLSQTPGREEDRRISSKDMIPLIVANRMAQSALPEEEDTIHTFTSNKGHRIDIPESLVQYIKNEH
jgi:hypothetical protein